MDKIAKILEYYWGFSEFRSLQRPIIESVFQKNDTLALLPTGGGKSVCFQIPTIGQKGICLVVTPLIALMKDQVENLKKRQIPAIAIYSGMSYREIDIALDNCIYGRVKFLYLSPERIKTPIFLERVQKMNVCLLAVDEAHCISEWGYDFRPTYLEVVKLRELFPTVPVLALTASATPIVQQNIQEKLGFREGKSKVFIKSFARENLSYSVFFEENKNQRVLTILQKVQGSAIIYVTSRKQSVELAHFLQKNKMSATYYHGGLKHQDRAKIQENWLNNKVRVMVATNAFGMGIDKADVRVVIHYGITRSLEAYYQEAGRVGRDEQKAYAVMLYDNSDILMFQKALNQKYPNLAYIQRVYQALANYLKLAIGSNLLESYTIDMVYFCQTYRLKIKEVYYALQLLQTENLIQFQEDYYQVSKVKIAVENNELYRFQVNNPNYHFFTSALLRIYGSELFTEYTFISERQLAENMGISEKQVIFYLKHLHKMSIVEYLPAQEMPQVTFLTPRLNAEKLPISQVKIEELKKREEEKLQAVISYAKQEKQCRSIQLCEYFGQQEVSKCGVCDNCLKQKKQHKNDDAFYQKAILQKLEKGTEFLMEEIVIFFPERSSDYIVEMCRKLLDSQQITYTNEGKIKHT